MNTSVRHLPYVLAFLTGWIRVGAEDRGVAVQILCINDFHGSILQTGALSNRPVGGAANLAAWLKDRRRSNPRTLLVHAGDMVGASQPISGLFQDEPTIEFLNSLGFDAGVPGNHEFDQGLDELIRLQRGGVHQAAGRFRGSSFPLVLANVVYRKTKNPIFPAYVIRVVEGIPIAFIGVVTRESLPILSAPGIRDLEFLDPAVCINGVVPELRKKGVETLVLLAHEGGTFDRKTGRIKGSIAEMAKKVNNAVDVILSGHSHTLLNGLVDGKLIVQAYSHGAAFVGVDLTISKTTRDVVSKKAEIVTVWAGQKKPDPETMDLIAPLTRKVQPILEKAVCRSAAEISKTQNDAGESALGDLIADAQRWAAKTQIAFMNSGGIRRSLPSGTITWGILYEAQPFGNRVLQFRMTGGQIHRLLNQQWRANRFLHVSGIRYSWSDRRPDGNKILRIALNNGTPIRTTGIYTVAANEVLASGSGRFSIFREISDKKAVKRDLDALVEYLKTMKQPVFFRTDGRVRRIR